MKSFLTLLLSFAFTLVLNAQKSPIKFGDIPMEDLKMVQYEHDTSASAVVLTDYGHAEMSITSSAIRMNFDRHIRIKILKKDGLEWANALIQLDHDGTGSSEEKVLKLRASTYNLENGQLVETKMSKDNVFQEKFDKYTTHQKFTLPNVKVGSVIEYSYTISSAYWSSLPNWQFQRSIPTRHSEYWAILPREMVYQKYMQGYVHVISKNPNSHWVAYNVPAFKAEPYMTSEEDYISRINFALSYINLPTRQIEIMGSWEKMNKNLTEDQDFMNAVKGPAFLKKQVDEVIAGITDPEAKARTIYEYVRNTYQWNGVKDRYPDNIKKIVEAKKGTSSDLNVLLAGMLNRAGIETEMVLLSTRDHGFIRRPFPMARQFNYNVCRVKLPDRTVLLDATDRYVPFGILPERCLNGEGFVISKTQSGWIDLDPTVKSKTVVSSIINIDPNGIVNGTLDYVHEGYAAARIRNSYHAKGQEEYLKWFQGGKTIEILESRYEDLKAIEKPAKESYEIVSHDLASSTGNQIYINPFVSDKITENPFRSDKREYPVDFVCPSEKVYISKIKIPAGYTVDELPPVKVIALPQNAGRFVYNISAMGDEITLTCILNINKAMFVQDEYAPLREFYNHIVAKQNEQIVLKKI